MAFNGSGVFVRLYSWVNDAAANIKIRADRMDNEMNGMATALSTCITKDGQTTVTANLPMAGFRHTGVGSGTVRNDYSSLAQVQDATVNWAVAGGSADALTATYSPIITTLIEGQVCFVRAANTNATTTPTFSPNGLTARTITKSGGAALSAGDITANKELMLRYNLANTRWEWQNAATGDVTLTGTQTLSNKTLTNPNIIGTTTNDNAAAGSVGQYLEAALESGSALALTTSTARGIITIDLTAGDWDVSGVVQFTGAGTTTVTNLAASLSLVSNTLDLTKGRINIDPFTSGFAAFGSSDPITRLIGPLRFSVASTTTVSLIAYSTFGVSTCSAYGLLSARRVR